MGFFIAIKWVVTGKKYILIIHPGSFPHWPSLHGSTSTGTKCYCNTTHNKSCCFLTSCCIYLSFIWYNNTQSFVINVMMIITTGTFLSVLQWPGRRQKVLRHNICSCWPHRGETQVWKSCEWFHLPAPHHQSQLTFHANLPIYQHFYQSRMYIYIYIHIKVDAKKETVLILSTKRTKTAFCHILEIWKQPKRQRNLTDTDWLTIWHLLDLP